MSGEGETVVEEGKAHLNHRYSSLGYRVNRRPLQSFTNPHPPRLQLALVLNKKPPDI